MVIVLQAGLAPSLCCLFRICCFLGRTLFGRCDGCRCGFAGGGKRLYYFPALRGGPAACVGLYLDLDRYKHCYVICRYRPDRCRFSAGSKPVLAVPVYVAAFQLSGWRPRCARGLWVLGGVWGQTPFLKSLHERSVLYWRNKFSRRAAGG